MERPKYHWLRDKLDTRDYLYKPTRVVTPSQIDLRYYCSPIEDQGNLGSCTGNAIAGAIELLNKRSGLPRDISRLFIYYYERFLEGTVNSDSGAYIRDGIRTCYTYGAPVESLWPYFIERYAVQPNARAISDASRRKVTLYQRVTDHAGCLDAISNGYPVVIGFDVYESFESDVVARTGMMPYPNVNTEELLGGHCVLLVGYDKTRQAYIARNSWGTGWGLRGYFYMPFQVIQDRTMSDDFWVIKRVNNP